MDILEELKSKFNLSDDMVAKVKEYMDAHGGQIPDWIQSNAGSVLDMIPGGLGDKLGDMLGVETNSDRAAASPDSNEQ